MRIIAATINGDYMNTLNICYKPDGRLSMHTATLCKH